MQFPTVNINGTHVDTLAEDLSRAKAALLEADNALLRCAPHGRDYPDVLIRPGGILVQSGTRRLELATREFGERVKRVRDVIAEIEALQEAVARQR